MPRLASAPCLNHCRWHSKTNHAPCVCCRVLKEMHGHKIAVIENEFGKVSRIVGARLSGLGAEGLCPAGEVGVDDALVMQSDKEEIIEMNNG